MNFINKNKKVFRCIIAVGISLSISALSVTRTEAEYLAAELNTDEAFAILTEEISASPAKASGKSVNIQIDGRAFTGASFLSDGTTYVSLRSISNEMGAKSVSWDDSIKTATVNFENLTVSAKNGENFIKANEEYIWNTAPNQIKSGSMFIPLRTICSAIGYSVNWSDVTKTAYINKISDTAAPEEKSYDADSVYWLSRIINAEAEGESIEGKIAVGNVVLNRVASPLFPNTIYGVIFDSKHGVQFTPTVNGTIYNTPTEESIRAAKLCLDGVNLIPQALFFMNDKIATSTWVSDNREYIDVIGNHKFYA